MEDRLQKFARLTEIGSFTKAAKILHISQPALSIAVDKLEQELGTELLIRENRKFELTPAGKAAYATAIEHQNSTDHLKAELSRIARRRPIVSIGMMDSVAAILCATEAFGQLEQTTNVTVVVNNSRYLREAVEQRQLDIAFVVDDGIAHPNIYKQIVGTEELVLVCHPDLLKTTEHDLAAGHIDNFISYDKSSTTYRHIMQTLRAHNLRTEVNLFSTSPDVLLSMARRGKGVGVLPRSLLADKTDLELAFPVLNGKQLAFQRPICLVSQAGKVRPQYLKQFIDNASL